MGGKDGETPPAEPIEDRGERCAYCRSPIDTSEWYPVTQERDADGALEFYHFCSEDCQDAWEDE